MSRPKFCDSSFDTVAGNVYYMGLNVTKPVFAFSDKARLKSASSVTETRKKIEISPVASLHDISNKRMTKGPNQAARMCRLVCAFVVRKPPKTGFLALRPI